MNSKLSSILVFIAVFVGDYMVYGQPIIALVGIVLLSVMFSGHREHTLKRGQVWYMAFLFVFILIELFRFSEDRFSGLVIITLIFNVVFLFFLRLVRKIEVGNSLFFSILIFLYIVTDSRADFLFGPNIWYRVLFFLIIFSSVQRAFLLSAPMLSGSRGSLVALMAYFLMTLRLKYVIFISVVVFILLSLSNLDYSQYRILLFSFSNGSVLDRYALFEFVSINSCFFGLSEGEWFEMLKFIRYPHNIFLSFLFRFGLFGILFIFFVVLNFRKLIKMKPELILLFVPLLFSGSIVDNLGMLTLIYAHKHNNY